LATPSGGVGVGIAVGVDIMDAVSGAVFAVADSAAVVAAFTAAAVTVNG
jgi:hypothetical protein